VTTLWQDIRYALRVLRKSPGFSAIAIFTLALGIGANTAIFTIVYGVLLRPLPFPQPERIVQLAETYKNLMDAKGLTATQLNRLRRYSEPFEFIAGYTGVGYNLTAGNAAEHLRGMPVNAEYFRVLGVHPIVGRDFLDEEDGGNGQHVAIVSYGVWSRRLGGDAGKIGQTILLNGEPFTLIGVMPRDFHPIGDEGATEPGAPDVWTPLALVAKTAGSGENISVLARLKPGVTPAQLQAQMQVVTQDFRREFPEDVGAELQLSYLPYQRMIGLDERPYLFVLLGAIGFVLLIACANVANLLLARGGVRGREISVRIALGATRGRIFQQLLTESFLIALAGGATGLFAAYAGLDSLLAIAPIDLPRAQSIHLDRAAFAFAFFVAVLTGAIFGLLPALKTASVNVIEALKEGARTGSSAGRARLRQGLVVAEFAMSLVLLTGAGMMIATFSKLLHTDPGFNPRPILSMQYWLIGSKYNSTEQIDSFNRALIQRLQSLAGVEAAGVIAAGLPLERGGNNGVRIVGTNSSQYYNTDYREVSPGYFDAMRIPLRQGRFLSNADSDKAAPVVVVNEEFAREHFQGRSPLGEHLYVSGGLLCEVVGEVGDVKSFLDRPPRPTTFISSAQASYDTSKIFEGWYPRSVVLRASVNPLSLASVIGDAFAAVDPLVPTGPVRSMEQVRSHSLALRSFMMTLLSFFAALALLLACVGIYGVISYAVSQRTREIGVRMALGAKRADVLRLVLAEAMKLILVGVVLGVAAAVALTKAMAGFLYGVSATNPFIFLSVILLLVIVSLAACYVPARRAMRVDPMVALRYE
jgi:putative ABC transport system permease protein